ncbi:MAG: hypothetical protein RL701_4026 [Pseudomonadota bacterium]|jgi:hypothetical protein
MRQRLRQAASATLLVHLVTSVCALATVAPLADSVTAGAISETPAVVSLYTLVRLCDALLHHPGRYLAMPLCVLWLLTPFLRVLWFGAQLTAAPLPQLAYVAQRQYLQALGVCGVALVYQALLWLAAWLASAGVAALLSLAHDTRLQTLAALVVSAPFAWAALVHAPSVSDLAHARLAFGERDARTAWRTAWRGIGLRACGVRTLYELGGAACLCLSLSPSLGWGAGLIWVSLVGQLCAALQTLLRACWCAWLVERIQLA